LPKPRRSDAGIEPETVSVTTRCGVIAKPAADISPIWLSVVWSAVDTLQYAKTRDISCGRALRRRRAPAAGAALPLHHSTALANERVHCNEAEQVVLRLKTP
jgi:hypothetical protein